MRIIGLAVIASLLLACSAKINSPTNSKGGVIDLDAIAAVINKENPDLVGLQEVDKFTKRCGNIDQAKVLAENNIQY